MSEDMKDIVNQTADDAGEPVWEIPGKYFLNREFSLPQEVKRMRILVVDDDAAARQFLSRVFMRLGFPAVAAGSGEDALELARSGAYDIAFIDMMLPGMGGLETLRAMRAVLPRLRAVLVTGYEIEPLREEAAAAGVLAHLEKPFFLNDILGALEKIHNAENANGQQENPGS